MILCFNLRPFFFYSYLLFVFFIFVQFLLINFFFNFFDFSTGGGIYLGVCAFVLMNAFVYQV